MSDWNTQIIDEFMANDGEVGGMFEGKPLLLLHHVGAKTGSDRTSPLMYQKLETGWAIFASKAGADTHPHWMHNVIANPDIAIRVGSEEIPVTARVASPEERAPIWERQKADHPQFADYEASTDREIPVVILEPR